MFYCKKCAVGCDVCLNESPCLSSYNWAFRISLLTITILCIIFTLLLGCYIYRFRKLKVIKVASPIFLCITLLGCSIMYSEVFQSSFFLSLLIFKLLFLKPISVNPDQQMRSKSYLFIPLKLY
jgi:hypothetical protein